MIGKYYETRKQVVFDHLSAFRSASRTETRRSLGTSPFGSQRQEAVEMIERMAGGDEAALTAFYRRFTHEEIAAQLATPLGTIKARIRRGMIHKRELLVEER